MAHPQARQGQILRLRLQEDQERWRQRRPLAPVHLEQRLLEHAPVEI